MADQPWRSLGETTGGDAHVLVTYFKLRRKRHGLRFLRRSLAVQRQLRMTDGLLGYSLRGRLSTGEFWTRSAWETPAHLRAFVGAGEHAESMRRLTPLMEGFDRVAWDVPASSLPIGWDEALQRLDRR